jgi:hypothetical protein
LFANQTYLKTVFKNDIDKYNDFSTFEDQYLKGLWSLNDWKLIFNETITKKITENGFNVYYPYYQLNPLTGKI